MSDLQQEYEGRITFNVISVSAEGAEQEIQKHELGTHGLVVYGADGAIAATIPGHKFGREEIESAIKSVVE